MYARSRVERDRARDMYRVYVTDCLRAIVGARERYADQVRPREDFDPQAVIDHVLSRARTEVR